MRKQTFWIAFAIAVMAVSLGAQAGDHEYAGAAKCKMCHKVLERVGDNDNPLFELALKLEEMALSDDYFVEKKLYPNVDFYSGIIYEALGIPKSMFTVMFAIARTVGWVAHWQEMIADPGGRIGRPRQLYTGPTERDYVAVDQRV